MNVWMNGLIDGHIWMEDGMNRWTDGAIYGWVLEGTNNDEFRDRVKDRQIDVCNQLLWRVDDESGIGGHLL